MEFNQIRNNAETYGIPIIRTESHTLLEEIVRTANPKHILEIGTAVGYSGILMLKNSTANLITIEHNKDYIKQAKKNFKKYNVFNRVKIINNDCILEIANMVCDIKYHNYFDLIFLDGPKAQYNLLLEGLISMLAPNGTFIADNVLFRGYVENDNHTPTRRYKTIIKRLNEFIENCKNHPKLTDFKLINIEDGVIFAKKVSNEKV